MRLFKASYKDRKGRARKSSKYYVEFKDHLDVIRRLPAFTDEDSSAEFGRKLEKLAALRANHLTPDKALGAWIETLSRATLNRLARIGLLERERVASSKRLMEHVEDWRAALTAKRNTAQHVKLVTARAKAVIEGCGFQYHSDVAPARVLGFLAEKRDDGLSIQSSNFHLQAFKQFYRWLVTEQRVSESPVGHLRGGNVKTDKRHERRALSLAEIRALLTATRQGEDFRGTTGSDRVMVYRVALETGLRWSELASLKARSFDLDAEPPTVSLDAADSKHRDDDLLPLRKSTAAALRDYLAGCLPNAPALRMPGSKVGAMMLRRDLKAAGIPYRDDAGRVVDFHALRHSFITNVANSGVHPSVARRLARHSDIRLTMNCYTHTSLERQVDAVEALPEIAAPAEAGEARATGTDDKSVLPECLAFRAAQGGTSRHESAQPKREVPKMTENTKALKSTGIHNGSKAKELEAAAGFEPANDGFANRCLRPLGYAASRRRTVSPRYPSAVKLSSVAQPRTPDARAPSPRIDHFPLPMSLGI